MGVYKILIKLFILSFLSIYSVVAYPLALSEAELKSHLNQVLDVRIELKSTDKSELDDLKVQLRHSDDNYGSRHKLKYEVIKEGELSFLKVTSVDAIREPIVEFTLDIGWSGGHVVREYSFLIDPPSN